MKSPLLLSLALGCGWLFSPEALVIVGNSVGNLGWLAIPLLALTALLFSFNANTINNALLADAHNNELSLLRKGIGTIPAGALTIASCFPLLILAATALLVTSGYTFNEVFLYWFPNFGFAFLLLGLLTLLQFLPLKLVYRVQLLFVSLAGLGIFILGVYGTLTPAKAMSTVLQVPEQISTSSLSSALLLLLFAGSNLFQGKKNGFAKVALFALLVFLPWMFASLAHVNPERLASSTIPFMTASRKIMGDTGRQIMGMVVIMGSCAAFTGLSLLCRQKLTELSQEKMAPFFLAKGGQQWLLPPLVAIAVGACMATGLAGDELLETLLRSALLLWLLYYCFVSFAAPLSIQAEKNTFSIFPFIAPLLLCVGLATILFHSSHTVEMLKFIIAFLVASSCLVTLLVFIQPKKRDTL
jgi:hypothetical protein